MADNLMRYRYWIGSVDKRMLYRGWHAHPWTDWTRAKTGQPV